MARAKEKALSLLGEAVVDLAAVAGTEVSLYTTPTGKKMTPVFVIADDFDEAVDEAVVTLGKTGGNCDEFLGNQTLTNITAGFVDEALILQPIPNAIPVAGMVLDAGESFGVEITTAETTGAATCTMQLWGREKPA